MRPASASNLKLTADEIRDRIADLSIVEHERLQSIARRRAELLGDDPRDLLQDAFVRALHARSCSPEVPTVAFLAGVMRSIVSQRLRSTDEIQAAQPLDERQPLIAAGTSATCAEPASPADLALSSLIDGRVLAKIGAAVADDQHLVALIEGLVDGLFGRELQQRLKMDARKLASLKRKLARRLEPWTLTRTT